MLSTTGEKQVKPYAEEQGISASLDPLLSSISSVGNPRWFESRDIQ